MSLSNMEQRSPRNEHLMAFIVIRQGMVDNEGIDKMAADFMKGAHKKGIQVTIGSYPGHESKLLVVTKSTETIQALQK